MTVSCISARPVVSTPTADPATSVAACHARLPPTQPTVVPPAGPIARDQRVQRATTVLAMARCIPVHLALSTPTLAYQRAFLAVRGTSVPSVVPPAAVYVRKAATTLRVGNPHARGALLGPSVVALMRAFLAILVILFHTRISLGSAKDVSLMSTPLLGKRNVP